MANLKIATRTETRIEKGVPLPNSEKDRAWPLREMEVGDSFALDRSRITALRSSISYERKCTPSKKFTVRTTPVETRCWRTA